MVKNINKELVQVFIKGFIAGLVCSSIIQHFSKMYEEKKLNEIDKLIDSMVAKCPDKIENN